MNKTCKKSEQHFLDIKDIYLCLALGALTLGVYTQVISFEFVNYDDPMYISGNKDLANGVTWNAIKFAFTSFYACNYHPLTWLSHMIDIELFKFDAGMHHLVNVLFHLINSIVLFITLKRLTSERYKSALVAALFALHPLHVESVAWVSERKDVLSTFFWLLTILAYAWYAERKGLLRYCAVVVAFGLGLMAKPMLVTLPFILILLDYWPLGRLTFGQNGNAQGRMPKEEIIQEHPVSSLILEKLPLFVLMLCAMAITVFAQKAGGAIRPLEMMPMGLRIENAIVSYGTYLAETFWPLDLSVFYPYVRHIPVWKVLLSGTFILCSSALSLILARRSPYLPVGWFWYLGTLVPVIGIVQVGSQAHADRYTYIPLIGIFILAVWGASELSKKWKSRKIILGALSAVVLTALAILAWKQVSYWKNDYTLFSHSISITSHNFLGHNGLGHAYLRDKNYDEAIRHFEEALLIKPMDEKVHLSLGISYFERGLIDKALLHYEKAVEIKPDSPGAHYNYALALESKGMMHQALDRYRRVLRLDPLQCNALNNVGRILAQEGHRDEAMGYYKKAADIQHNFVKPYVNMALLLTKEKKYDRAISTVQQALVYSPADKSLLSTLAGIYQRAGETERSIEVYKKVLSMDPRSPEILRNLGYAYSREGNDREAVGYLIDLTQIEPDNPDNFYNVACIYSRLNNVPEALRYLDLAISKGFRNWILMKRDSDLENIRETAAFRDYIQGGN